MSKILANLFQESERELAKVVAKLEELSGYHSEDVRFTANLQAESFKKIRSLGLDPQDTTSQELYHALQAKLQADVKHLSRALNISDADSPEKLTATIQQLCGSGLSSTEVWAIKKSAAKSLLRSYPPKQTMKLLKFRSLESMLKRADAAIVMSLALKVEPAIWQKQFNKVAEKLKPADFEAKQIEVVCLPQNFEQMPDNSVQALPIMGAVILKPSSSSGSIYSFIKVLDVVGQLEASSISLKAQQFGPNFGKAAAVALRAGGDGKVAVAGQEIFDLGQLKNSVGNNNSGGTYSHIHPALSWWQQGCQAAVVNGEVISMHIVDALHNLQHSRDFAHRSLSAAAAHLKSQLLAVYLKHSGVKNYLSDQLDDTFEAIESAAPARLEPALEFETA